MVLLKYPVVSVKLQFLYTQELLCFQNKTVLVLAGTAVWKLAKITSFYFRACNFT